MLRSVWLEDVMYLEWDILSRSEIEGRECPIYHPTSHC